MRPWDSERPPPSVSGELSVTESADWAAAEDLEQPQESAWDGAGYRGSAPAPDPVGRSVRALVGLFQVAGLSGGGGWRALLYAGLLYALSSAVGILGGMADWVVGWSLVGYGVHWIRASVLSSFFGVGMFIPWMTLTASFVCGRRRYGALLSQLLPLLRDTAELRNKNEAHGAPAVWHIWLIVIAAPVSSCVGNLSIFLDWSESAGAETGEMSAAVPPMVLLALVSILICMFQLVPVKFLLAARLLEGCQTALNGALAAAVDRRAGADSGRRLRRAARTVRRLSDCLALLTSAAAAELTAAMLLGVLVKIQMVVAALDLLANSGDVLAKLALVAYMWSALVVLVGPCEAGERLLAGLSRSRSLLLRLEETRPQLAARLERLQRAITADLETAGDLGLFRLRRATLLSIWSAIITYIIVMMQFLGGDAGAPGDTSDWTAWADHNVTL